MNQSSLISIGIVAILLVGGCTIGIMVMNGDGDDDLDYSRDAVGREVVVPDNLDKGIVTIGVGTARWTSYFGLAEKIVLRDYRDNSNFFGKSYMYANDCISQKSANAGAGLQTGDVETILELSPSLVVLSDSEYNQSTHIVDALVKGGCNVVVVFELESMIDSSSLGITEKFEYQTKLLGKVFKEESRANQLLDGINDILDELRSMTATLTKADGYIGGLAYSGTKGANATSGTYIPFILAGINNVIPGDSMVGEKSPAEIKDRLTDDTIVFIDESAKRLTGTGVDPTQMSLIKIFNEKGLEGYVTMPYIYFGMNFENVLIAAYQIISYVHPDVLSEDQFLQKADGIFDLFLGTHDSSRTGKSSGVEAPVPGASIFEDMSNVFDNSTSANGLGTPIYAVLSFNSDGTITV